MAAIALNKGDGDFLSGYSKLETPEERMECKVEGGLIFEGFESLLKKYERFLNLQYIDLDDIYKRITKINRRRRLTPEKINAFLQATISYEEHKNHPLVTGAFISSLIQSSYNVGHNNFHLNANGIAKPLRFIGYRLEGKRKRPIQILIEGSAGEACGGKANVLIWNDLKLFTYNYRYTEDTSFDIMVTRYCDFNSELFGDRCGNLARHSSFRGKEFGDNCGIEAKCCTFIGKVFGKGCGEDAYGCVFKTSSQESLERLMRYVEKSRSNKIYFTHPDGKEEKMERRGR
ncbi:MAG: hypothetical protein ABIB71_06385 [Candidatus Woesearchaeota archaeon]